MSEKKKQEYTTGGLKNRQDVENALASAEYRPSREVTDAASDLKQEHLRRIFGDPALRRIRQSH